MSQEPYDIQLPGDAPRTRELMQAIDAEYFNVSNAEGAPIASLIVLLDRKRLPVRAELHLSSTISNEAGAAAVRQAQHILEDHYAGPETLSMQVWQSFLRSDTLEVPLPPAHEEATGAGPRRSFWPVVAAVAALLIVVVLTWAFFFRSGTTTAEPTPAPADASQSTGAQSPADTSMSPSFDLPPSRNADPNLSIGRRVRIKPGLRLTLRSEAGAEAGEAVGFMENGQEAVIVAGPTLLQGNNDTIVWWFVRLDNGLEAWAAANTSELTLLEPVQ